MGPIKAANQKVSATVRNNYNLTYFNLWWRRMQREGEKEGKERAQREEAGRRKEMLRRSLMMRKKRKTALLSEVDKGIELNNPEVMNEEQSVSKGGME